MLASVVDAADYDRAYSLSDLLDRRAMEQAATALAAAAGAPVTLVGSNGAVLATTGRVGKNGRGILARDVRVGGEIAGRILVGPLPEPDHSRALAAIELFQLTAESLYAARITSDVHSASMRIAFADLEKQLSRAEQSEGQYRELSEELEERVEARTAELQRAYGALVEQEKLASVGLLAAGVAHEVNNPIGFVTSNLRTLHRWLESGRGWDNEVAEVIDESLVGLGRVQRIVSDLSNFSRVPQHEETPTCDVTSAVEEMINLVAGELRARSIQIETRMDPVPAMGAPTAVVKQALVALIKNAISAVPEVDAKIEVVVGAQNGNVFVSVLDNGAGVSEEHRPRLFEPFFTTRDVDEGKGLGLAAARQALQKHGGDVSYSPRRQGSSFTILAEGLADERACGTLSG